MNMFLIQLISHLINFVIFQEPTLENIVNGNVIFAL